MFNDDDIEKYYRRIQTLISDAHKDNKKVALWGIGNRGKTIIDLLDVYSSVKFDYVVDENVNIDDYTKDKYNVVTPNKVYELIDIVIISVKSKEIIKEIKAKCNNKIVYSLEELWDDVWGTFHIKKWIRMTKGYCPCCLQKTEFAAEEYWLRGYYRCVNCGSIPRQRALRKILNNIRPNYRMLTIHECSPSKGVAKQLSDECNNYSYSYFYEEKELGQKLGTHVYNENLEKLTFKDNSFDIFISQDVMEHVANPYDAFKEIARVLKVGGIHIFTTPIYLFQKTRMRVKIEEGKIQYILPPVYHGNPISSEGSLVTIDYGDDIAEIIDEICGNTKTTIYQFPHNKENFEMGLEADFLHVIVTEKVK